MTKATKLKILAAIVLGTFFVLAAVNYSGCQRFTACPGALD